MTDHIDTMKLALEALEDLGMKHYESTGEVLYKETFNALRQAIEQAQKQEPVAWIIHDRVAPDRLSFVEVKESLQTEVTPLYKKE